MGGIGEKGGREQRLVRVFRETGPPPRNEMKKGVGKTNRSVVLTAVGSSQERLWALPVLVGKRNVQVKV